MRGKPWVFAEIIRIKAFLFVKVATWVRSELGAAGSRFSHLRGKTWLTVQTTQVKAESESGKDTTET